MNSTQRPLTGFEERLLTELRRVIVVERQVESVAGPARPPRFRWSRRVALAGGVALVLAVASAAGVPFLVAGEGVEPAYAVTANGDGTVTIEINSLSDADGLERKLREAGIPAEVQYLPPGKACKEPTFEPAAAPSGSGRVGSSMGKAGGGAFRFTIDTGTIVAGQTLVIFTQEHSVPSDELPSEAAGEPQEPASSIAIAWAEGEVAQCEVVDADDALPSPGNAPSGATLETRTGSGEPGKVLHTSGG